MATRIIPLVLLVTLWPARTGADEPRSTIAGCHAAFPGKHMTTQERTPTSGWVFTELQETDKGSYALSAFNLPSPIPPAALDAALNRTRAEVVAARGYQFVSESRLKRDGFPGLEVVMEKKQPGGEVLRVRMRLYFVEARVYQIQVSGEKAWTEADEATKFLDSFRLGDQGGA